MVAAECGNLQFAYDYFLKTAKIDIEGKYKVYVGTVFMGGSHPAANGGAWMTAVFGFGGVTADEKQLAINPRLYCKWKSLKFRMVYRGDAFSVRITQTSVEISADTSNQCEHTVCVSGRQVICAPGRAASVRYR